MNCEQGCEDSNEGECKSEGECEGKEGCKNYFDSFAELADGQP